MYVYSHIYVHTYTYDDYDYIFFLFLPLSYKSEKIGKEKKHPKNTSLDGLMFIFCLRSYLDEIVSLELD